MVGDTTSLTRITVFPAVNRSCAVVTFRSAPAAGLASGTSPGQILTCVRPAAGCQVFSWAAARMARLVAAQKITSTLDMLPTHSRPLLHPDCNEKIHFREIRLPIR